MKTQSIMPYTEYKLIDINWLDRIPSHWHLTRLKYLGKTIIGLTYKPEEITQNSEGFLVLRSSNIQNGKLALDDNIYVKKCIPKKLLTLQGDILICVRNGSRALIGKNALITKKSSNITFGAFMSIFRSNLNFYLKKVFESNIFEHQSGSYLTSTINQLTSGNLNSFEIPLPYHVEQIQIAKFLDHETSKIDRLIEKQQQLIELLKEKRQAVISHAVTKGLNPNAPLKPSGVEWLGAIPKDWSLIDLRFITRNIGGSTPNKSRLDYWNGNIPWVSPKDMKTDLIHNSIEKITNLAIRESNIKSIPENSILIVVRGMILDKNVPIAQTKTRVTINQDMKALIPSKNLKSDYLLYSLKGLNSKFLNIVENSAHGTKCLPTSSYERIKIPIPPLRAQLEIINILKEELNNIDKTIEKSTQFNKLLQERRTALISAAVTGKIDVRDWRPPASTTEDDP